MNFDHSYNAKRLLYLKIIEETAFSKITFREMDLIACIMCNRSDKKISSILNIKPKTVSVHIQNIMLKLNFNSRDQIIDFVEKFSFKILL